jgi:hypothetical protein
MNLLDLSSGDIVGAVVTFGPYEFWITAGCLTLLSVVCSVSSQPLHKT